MKDEDKTKGQMMDELEEMRQRIAKLEASKAERKRAAEALCQERNRAQKYLDVAGVMLVAIDADQRVSLMNKKGCEVLEYKEDEIIGKNWFDNFIAERVRDEVKAFFNKLVAGEVEPAEYFENPVLTKSGEERIITWNNSILTDEQGNIIGTLSSGEDITERKKAEEALQESKERFKELAEKSPLGVVVADDKANHLYVNKRYAEITGYSVDELISMNGFEVLTLPEEKGKYREIMKKRIKGEPHKDIYERTLLRKDSTVVLTEFFTTKVKWEGKMCPMAIVEDITERKRLEENLEKERQEFKLIIDTSPIIIFYKDVKGRFVRVNKAFTEVLKIPEENFLGKTVFDLYSTKIAQSMTNDDEEVFKSGSPKLNIIEQYESANGIKWVQTDKIPIFDKNGIPTGLIGYAQDITEHKRVTEKLEESVQEKEVLIREIHHRVKNNLQVISSILDMSSLRIRDKQANDLIINARSKIHSIAIIHSQLYTSESFGQIDMGSHIREMIAYLFQIYTESGKITPIVKSGTIYLELVIAVPYAIILNELVANALRHAFEGREKGMIRISAEKLADGTILTRVKDDGIGISPEFDITTVDTLGLKLVRNIVKQQLKGKIQVERDKGTEFIIEFKP